MINQDGFPPLSVAKKLSEMSLDELSGISLAAVFEMNWSKLEDSYVLLGDLLSETAPISREGRASLRTAIGEMFSQLYLFDHTLTVVEVLLEQRL